MIDYIYLYNIATNTIYTAKVLEKAASFIHNKVKLEESGKIVFMNQKILKKTFWNSCL